MPVSVSRPIAYPPYRRGVRAAVAAAGACLGAGMVSGCAGLLGAPSQAAEVRFVDTSRDAPPLDLYVNNTGAAYHLENATFSSYVAVVPGTYQIRANKANSGQVLVNAQATLAGAHQYTAVISNRLGSMQENIYPDTPPAVTPGTMAVRVINAADTGPLDVYVVPSPMSLGLASPVASGLGYAADAGYVRLQASPSYTVVAVPSGVAPTMASAVTVSGTTLSGGSGAVRTVVLTDAAKIDGKGVYAFVLDDSEAM